MSDYIRENFQGFSFGHDYVQVFANKWMINLMNEEIIKLKHNNVITDEDLEIVKFIYRYKFATVAIVADYLDNGDTYEIVKGKLDRLCKNRLLNKFMLSRTREEKPFPDALMIYCLDFGGKVLLSHYDTPNNGIEGWWSSSVMMSSPMIGDALVTAHFYVQVKKNVGDKLLYFRSQPNYRIGKTLVIPSFELCIVHNEQRKYFVGENAREYDFPVGFREKMIKLESILGTKAWMKYFSDVPQAPSLLVVAEDDNVALEASQIISSSTMLTAFRLTTDARSLQPLGEAGAFLKYDTDEGHLVGVRSSVFAK